MPVALLPLVFALAVAQAAPEDGPAAPPPPAEAPAASPPETPAAAPAASLPRLPVLRDAPAPPYPPDALAAGKEALVHVELAISA